jgi:hypothetical protein
MKTSPLVLASRVTRRVAAASLLLTVAACVDGDLVGPRVAITGEGMARSQVAAASADVDFVSASSNQTSGNSITLAGPDGLQPGDVMIAQVVTQGSIRVSRAPEGWTLIRGDYNGSHSNSYVYWRRAGSAEPAGYSWSLSGSTRIAGGIAAYRNVAASGDPIDAHGGQHNAASIHIVAPSITTTNEGAYLVGLFSAASEARETTLTFSPPGGMLERYDLSSQVKGNQRNVVAMHASIALPAVGATGTRTAVLSAARPGWGQLIALRPAGPPAVSITIEPGNVTFTALGQTQQLTATAWDAQGNPVAAEFTWSSSASGVAIVDANGLVTAKGNGTASIIARAGEITGVASVEVAAPTPSGGNIEFVSASSNQTSGNSISLAAPDGLQPGDVMIAQVVTQGSVQISQAPEGWTLIRGDYNGSHSNSYVYWRRAGSAEPAGYPWSLSGSTRIAGGIAAYRNVAASGDPIDAHDGQHNAASTNIVAPSITTTEGAYLVGLFSAASEARETTLTFSPPGGMLERYDLSSRVTGNQRNVVAMHASMALPAIGATGTRTAVLSAARPGWGQLIALKPAGPPANSLVIHAGDAQSAPAGTVVPIAPSVRVTDAAGNPVAGVSVTFSVASGGGSVTGATQTTNSDGIATVGSWTLGSTPGENTLTASAAGLTPVTFTATGTTGSAATVDIHSGDGQSAPAGTAVPIAPSVRVTDAAGNPVSGVSVTFSVASGGGSVTGATQTTNSDGIATVGSWTLGTTPGENTLQVSVADLPPITFTATGTATGWIHEAEFVLRPTSISQLGTLEKSNKPLWWHDGHWWILAQGWRAFRRDAPGVWTQASDVLMGQNSRRLDVHVQPNGDIVFHGQHATDSRIGTARYDPGTRSYTSTSNFSAPAANGSGAGTKRWAGLVIDSHGRAWVNYGLSGQNQVAAYDLDTQTELQAPLTIDASIWTTEHLSRIVAFTDAQGPKIGVILEDQVSDEIRFWVRRDSDPLDAPWKKEVVASGPGEADDHADIIATPSGELLAVWKTELFGASDPNIRYARRTITGTWVDHTTVRARFGQPADNEFTRPRIQYDRNHDYVYIVAYTRDVREVHVMRSTRLNPDFGASGPPAPGKAWPTPFAFMNTDGNRMVDPVFSAAATGIGSGLFFACVGESDGQIWGLRLPLQ